MYRNQFVKKSGTGKIKTLKNVVLKPEESIVRDGDASIVGHARSIGSSQIRSITRYKEGDKTILEVNMYDNVYSTNGGFKTLDFYNYDVDGVVTSTIMLPLFQQDAESESLKGEVVEPHLSELQGMFDGLYVDHDSTAYYVRIHFETLTMWTKRTTNWLPLLENHAYTETAQGYLRVDLVDKDKRKIYGALLDIVIDKLYLTYGTQKEDSTDTLESDNDVTSLITFHAKVTRGSVDAPMIAVAIKDAEMHGGRNLTVENADGTTVSYDSKALSIGGFRTELGPEITVEGTEKGMRNILIKPWKLNDNHSRMSVDVSRVIDVQDGFRCVDETSGEVRYTTISLMSLNHSPSVTDLSTPLACRAACDNLRVLEYFEIQGSIPTDTPSQPEMKYVYGVTFRNCVFKDKPKKIGEGESATDSTVQDEWLWFYDCKFENCDMQMKNYKIIDTSIGRVEVTPNPEPEPEPEPEPQPQPIEPTKSLPFNDLKELYSWLFVPHKVVPWSEDITTKEEGVIYMKMIEQEYVIPEYTGSDVSRSVYYHERTAIHQPVIDFGVSRHPVFLVPLDIEYQGGDHIDDIMPGEYEFALCYEISPSEYDEKRDIVVRRPLTQYFRNTYYGFLADDEMANLFNLFKKINTMTMSVDSTDGKSIMTLTNTNLSVDEIPSREAMTNSEKTGLLDKIKNIVEMIPYSTGFDAEIYALIMNLVNFEKTRMPSYKESEIEGGKPYGLDANHSNCLTRVVVPEEEVIRQQKFIENNVIYVINESGYMWGSHQGLVNPIDLRHELLVQNIESWSRALIGYSIAGTNQSYEYERSLYDVVSNILDYEILYYTQEEPQEMKTVTYGMVDDAEFEIYEEESVYQVHYATVQDDIVIGLDVKGRQVEEGASEDCGAFITGFLKNIESDIKEYLGLDASKEYDMEIDSFAAYLKPEDKQPETEGEENVITRGERDELIEYSQMLNTIQGQRDLIQKSGNAKRQFLLKFMQNAKGTYFEILGSEKSNYDSEEQVYGYYVSQGYGNTQVVKEIGSKKRGKGSKKAVPNMVEGRYRITRMSEFYNQEPLDWRNDNYYCNQIYTQNADNLNVVVDPEFSAKTKVIKTLDEKCRRTEQEMVGFYMISLRE